MRTSMHLTNTTRITFDASPPAIEISDTITGDSIVLHLPHMAHVRRHLLEALATEALRFSRELGPAPDPIRPPSADGQTFVAPELHEPASVTKHMSIFHAADHQPRHDIDAHGIQRIVGAGDKLERIREEHERWADDAAATILKNKADLAAGDHFAGMPDGVVIPFLDRNRPDVGAGE